MHRFVNNPLLQLPPTATSVATSAVSADGTPGSGAPAIAVLASYAPSLILFRGPLLRAIRSAGWRVIACAPEHDPDVERALAEDGIAYRRIPMARAGLDPHQDLRTLAQYLRFLRHERPDLVLAYTMKPIIWGGIAARLVSAPRFVAMITGLGYAFGDERGWRRRLVRMVSDRLYRVALAHAERVIVFNPDDEADIRAIGAIAPDVGVTRVDGSGVDLTHYTPAPLPPGPPVFLLIARLLREKGVLDFVEAAKLVRPRWPQARFRLVGALDDNPTGIASNDIAAWCEQRMVEYGGAVKDVRGELAACSVFVLPSYYREGIPRAVVEAMATGRPIITADTPGCRETVVDEVNGLLVPPRDPKALAGAMVRLLEDPDLLSRMGAQSLAMARERFEVGRINAQILATLGIAS